MVVMQQVTSLYFWTIASQDVLVYLWQAQRRCEVASYLCDLLTDCFRLDLHALCTTACCVSSVHMHS